MSADIDKFRQRLVERRAELRALSDVSAPARATVQLDQQSVGRLSRMDAMQQQAMAQASERQRAGELARIEAALLRIEAGEYGYCLECGKDVGEKRLEMNPAAALCITCAQAHER